MIHVTEKAAEQIKIVRGKEGFDDSHGLRVSAVGGGCSGLSYKLQFDKAVGADDRVYEENGVRIIVDKKSLMVLNGTSLDFTDGLNGSGFVFSNPNATASCGCGSSFSV
jgi:iron-sulfur cluster assembly protein